MAWDCTIGAVSVKLDFPPAAVAGGSAATGTWTFQNSTPTDLRFQNSEPGFGDTAPYSARTYANQAGSIGKQSEIQAPADLARPYLCDLDNGRPGYLAPRLRWDKPGAAGNVTFTTSFTGKPVKSACYAHLDTTLLGTGAICTVGDAGTINDEVWWYWYNATTRQYEPYTRLNLPNGIKGGYLQDGSHPGTVTSWGPFIRGPLANPTIKQIGPHLWIPRRDGGAIDAAVAYGASGQPQVAAGTMFWHLVALGPYVITFEQLTFDGSQPGLRISLRGADDLVVKTPTTLSGIDASPELGNGNIQVTVPNLICCHTPVVYNGAVYFCSDREVFKLIYDDQGCRLLVVPIHTSMTRITADPEIFQGSLWIASGNTLWKWTPGQLEFVATPVDSFGDLPADRGGGVVTALKGLANGMLVATQSGPDLTGATDSCVLKMDTNNVFQLLDYATSNGAVLSQVAHQFTWFVDGYGANPIIGVVCTDSGPTKRVVSVPDSNRDPVYFPHDYTRTQVAGSHFWISPVDPGVNFGDRKQPLKVAAMCADVNAAVFARIYYQYDLDMVATDDMSAGFGNQAAMAPTIMKGTGAWHLALVLNNTTSGLTAQGGGSWAGYAEQVLTTMPIIYRQIRWCIEIIGDTSGVYYPRLLGMKFYYSETPAMYIVHSLRIRILAGDPDLADAPTGGAFPPPRTAADVYAHFSQLYNYARLGTFVDFLDPNGDHRLAKITKLIFNGVDLAAVPDGVTLPTRHRFTKVVMQLALQEADSAAGIPLAA